MKNTKHIRIRKEKENFDRKNKEDFFVVRYKLLYINPALPLNF